MANYVCMYVPVIDLRNVGYQPTSQKKASHRPKRWLLITKKKKKMQDVD